MRKRNLTRILNTVVCPEDNKIRKRHYCNVCPKRSICSLLIQISVSPKKRGDNE